MILARTAQSLWRVSRCVTRAAGGCPRAQQWGLQRRGLSGASRYVMTSKGRGRSHSCRQRCPLTLLSAAAFSIFSKTTEKDEDLSEPEEEIVFLLKKSKLSIMKGELDEAEELLHKILHLAQQCESKRAVIYTYDLMANLAFLRGQHDNAEKLFKTTMVHMLDNGIKQDDNSFLEISLKLASIYAAQNKRDLAVPGFQFCIKSLEEKTEKEKDLPEELLTAEAKTNTRLLLGLSLDSYARYLVTQSQLFHAQTMYEKAIRICKEEQGEMHPQTITLLNDLATVLEAQGRYDEAYATVTQALHLAEKSQHPDHHIVLGNMASILMHRGISGETEDVANVEWIFRLALSKAEEKEDAQSIQHIKKGLSELAKWKKKRNQNP
ncbi:tetratricopeptide repeat protein 19, mitochondrial [Hyperolius riggenbachi]|uniref:tetratricopeptide repeat protein 19, mitochondrial n=1 Tax=Hyperolius riggenbachi TaxID=752182 RepID=UPI0035A3D026